MNALQILQEKDYTLKLELFKNVPKHAITKTRFTDTTSNGLTKCILAWLSIHNHWATRINTTGRFIAGTSHVNVIGQLKLSPGKWIPGTTKNGTADIHAVINGRHVSIEVKAGRDVMSPEQEKTKTAIENSGGLYFIAKDFESFYQFYQHQTQKI